MDKSIIDALLQICEPFLRKNDLERMYGELEGSGIDEGFNIRFQ